MSSMIKVNNVTKRFGPTLAVDNVSFEVNRSEVLGFLGPNAAGKTTTMRVLTCYMPPDEGSATVAGYDIMEDSLEVRKQIGYLPESAPLYLEMGVLEYLAYIAEIRGIPSKDRSSRVKNMLEVCGLEQVVRKDLGELSRGFRQRVCLAQTLIHDPEILILDEPTSGLDPSQIIEIRELIKEIGREKTVILSTHILPEVSATCSRVLIINEGRLIASGTTEELAERARGGITIYAKIRGPQEEIEGKLARVEGINSFRKIAQEGDDLHRFCLETKGQADPSEEVFRLVRDSGWSLSELRREEASLEDLFLQLTTKET
jgi:ABC-2 type transport system ATP-binding protein